MAKSLAEHQNPDTLKRLNEANRAKKICCINSISIPLLVRRSVKKLFKEQEYHDAVRHHTEAIQRNLKEPTTRPRGMQDPRIKNILTEFLGLTRDEDEAQEDEIPTRLPNGQHQ
ncbi:hypothetical protein HID58_056107 [Brassica napus]|uniref:Uncharacterized protein n=1 Tax=Brassica napus TaxID=3708 RepID=A0ABQ8AN97_BRANA|nr:hypothetical protein HID58_056107 [Brassica napus]